MQTKQASPETTTSPHDKLSEGNSNKYSQKNLGKIYKYFSFFKVKKLKTGCLGYTTSATHRKSIADLIISYFLFLLKNLSNNH